MTAFHPALLNYRVSPSAGDAPQNTYESFASCLWKCFGVHVFVEHPSPFTKSQKQPNLDDQLLSVGRLAAI